MIEKTHRDSKAVVLVLGYSGLLPFLAFALWAIFAEIDYMPVIVFCYYSAGILCFLAGSLWRHQSQSIQLLVQSNLIVLLAVASLVMLHIEQVYSLVMLSVGFCMMLFLDWYKTDYEQWYKRFRLVVTAAVLALHGILIAL